MENKTVKILTVTENQRSYDGSNGKIFIHLITFEGDAHSKAWEYHSIKPVCEKFKAGEMADVETDVQQNGNFTNYRIKPAKQDGAGGKFPAYKRDEGVIAYLSCLSSAAAYYAGKSGENWSHVLDMADQAFERTMKKSTLKP